MELGAFSISLTVKNIRVSQEFYGKLGFAVYAGDINKNYIIMKNGDSIIGLFQGMFEGNILTFNPGWNQNAENLSAFTDIRDIQKELKTKDIPITLQVDEHTTGPASFTINDPDGNAILFDQHI